MQYAETIAALRAIPLFANLELPKLKLLAFACAYLTLEDGEALFHEGEPSDSVYVIDDGRADICVGEEAGGEVKVATLGRQALIGEMGIFRNSGRSATIRAVGPLKVLRIDGDVFLRIVTESPDAALRVMHILSDKLARTTENYERLKVMARQAGLNGSDSSR
ncbi:MAG: cyclic nucleotide-binding domain-containing protein [Rhodospirillales bacterium]